MKGRGSHETVTPLRNKFGLRITLNKTTREMRDQGDAPKYLLEVINKEALQKLKGFVKGDETNKKN
jgi:hypothetical protein